MDVFSNGQVSLDLIVKLGVRSKQLLNGAVFDAPGLVGVVSLVTREEAVVRQKLATVARGKNDLVPLSLLSSPILQGSVLGVVDEAEPDSIFGCDVGMKTAGVGGALLGADADEAANGRADAVCTDDEVMLDRLAILELNATCFQVDVLALFPVRSCSACEMRTRTL